MIKIISISILLLLSTQLFSQSNLTDFIPSGAPEVFDDESTELYKREIMRDHVLKQRDGGNWSFLAVEINGERKILTITASHVIGNVSPGEMILPGGDFFGFETSGGSVYLEGKMLTDHIGPTLDNPTTMKFKIAEIDRFWGIDGGELENPGADDWKTIRTFPIEQNPITPEDAGYIFASTQSGNWAIGADPIPGYDPDLAERFVCPVNTDPSGGEDNRTRMEIFNDGNSANIPSEVFNADVPNLGIFSRGGPYMRVINNDVTPEMMSDKQLGLEDSKKILENSRVLGPAQTTTHPNDNEGILNIAITFIYPYIQEIKEQLAAQYGVSPEDIVFCTEAYDMRVNGVGDVETVGRVVDHITSVEAIEAPIPQGYKLEQNYPNPFNPTTKIIYLLTKESLVLLEVLDIKGERVKILVNDLKNVGSHSIIFDGSNLASGVYLYRLHIIDEKGKTIYLQGNKMLLLK